MKRILTCLLLLLAVQLTWASSVNSIFHEFKEERNAEYVSVSPFLLWIGRLAMGNEDEATKDIMKKVKINILKVYIIQLVEQHHLEVQGID